MNDDERAILTNLYQLQRAQEEAIKTLGLALTALQHSHQAISDWLQKLDRTR
jgi:hypothetical protein